MQSQQKRVKWSRGETSEALEERTDTGITQASVELMENCIPDVYGNISRRPALKLMEGIKENCFSFGYDWYPSTNFSTKDKFIPFYITEDDIILFNIRVSANKPDFIRIRNGIAVKQKTYDGAVFPNSGYYDTESQSYIQKPVSYSQQNNYMVIATETDIYKLTITTNGDDFTPTFELFNFSAGWYAPYGTETKQVNTTDIPGLNVSGHFYSYTYTNSAGDTNIYSWTDTGLDGQTNLELIAENIPLGSIVQFPENGAYLRVEGYVLDNNNVMMYGELLTPVANENATDNRLKVEYGYVDLMPHGNGFPHPRKVAFYNQRLWAGDWKFSATVGETYSLVIGSQIAKYNDFENNYNQENEAITLDILTQFRENITHIGDYNGLKIMTDAYEYSYQDGAPVRQSANGSLAQCEPIIFEGLCLYADSTGNQIRAMQYEFQSNLFNSSGINTMAPHDLIWNPITLATFEDKIYSTGKYLFVVNEEDTNIPRIAVCNFVPTNQANIWSRWSFPDIYTTSLVEPQARYMNLVYDIVQTKKYPIFILKVNDFTNNIEESDGLVPAVLDFEGTCDLETTLDNNNRVIIAYKVTTTPFGPIETTYTLAKTEIAVYSDGEFKFLTTTTDEGYITDDLTGLTNITVGIPINATVRSHPIDVGGKTKSIKKRIGKTVMSVHDTEAGAITINGKTGYMNPQGDKISFYGVTGMKDEIRYTLTNKNGAMFHLESLLMNIEYGTLDS